MLLRREDIHHAYEQIKMDAVSGGCSVFILVAPDADAICSCRILAYLLRIDHISYKIRPVQNYREIADSKAEFDSCEVKTVVMINCGAIIDVLGLLGSDDEEASPRFFILDSHRPVHLTNIHAKDDQVVVFDDGLFYSIDIPSDGEILDEEEAESEEESEEEAEEGEEDEEAEFDNDDGSEHEWDQKSGQEETGDHAAEDGEEVRQEDKSVAEEGSVLGDAEDNGEDDGLDSEDEETLQDTPQKEATSNAPESSRDSPATTAVGDSEDDASPSGKRKLDSLEEMEVPDEKRIRKQKVREYYSGNYYGVPSALVLFELCYNLNRAQNDQLWMACLGLTDYYVHQKIDETLYRHLHQYLKSHIQDRNAPDEEEEEEEDASKEFLQADDGTLVPLAEAGKLTAEDDFRFFMYRHWSLYEAMYFSPYVASRLVVWKQRGKDRFQELLAKMGISLEQCKQKWTFMPAAIKDRVRDKLQIYGEDYGLEEIEEPSFQRCNGFRSRLSASDVVLAVTALLEDRSDEESTPQDAFWRAYEAIPSKDQKFLTRGLTLSMTLQRALVQQAIGLIAKHAFTCLTHFRYAYIPRTHTSKGKNTPDLFAQPLALAKLALFLIEIHRQNEKWTETRARPLVILAERPTTYLVAGIMCPEKPEGTKHHFGKAFRRAADACQAHIRHDNFETSVVEINHDDAHRFVESLHYSMRR